MSIDRFPKKPCRYCGNLGHFTYMCHKNPKNIARRNGIKKNGKYAKQWTITRQTWIRNNPPTIDGKYWECYLKIHDWCPIRLTERTLTLDHVVSRSHAPDKRFSADNLRPACIYCNSMKGSKSLEKVRAEMVK